MEIKPLQIGDLTIKVPVILAPMAGYTDMAMRVLCHRYGSGLGLTEVISTQAINYESKRTFDMLHVDKREHPVGAHLYGHDPEAMARAARTVEKLGCFDLIDINCGCPVRKLVTKGNGVALMKSPKLIGEIVSAVSNAVSLPVTVKTRIGVTADTKNISEVAQAVEEGGGKAIFIHARFASDQHRGKADWDSLAKVKSERDIPVIGNGGIDVASDVLAMFKETSVDGVMIGRAALGNPWFFDEVCCLIDKKIYNRCSLDEWAAVIIEHLMMIIAMKEKAMSYQKKVVSAEESAVVSFRGHLSQYISGMEGGLHIRRNMDKIKSLQDVKIAVEYVVERQKRENR